MPLNIGCTARPGKGRDNRTGSWRIFYPIVEKDTCTGCGICTLICPEGCIEVKGEKEYIPDLDYCKGCGLCAEECPGDAITMEKEEK